eukprot:evm.model.scf_228.4 EVM.evm.TU.scf_228.4   scf_228:16588-19684(+)
MAKGPHAYYSTLYGEADGPSRDSGTGNDGARLPTVGCPWLGTFLKTLYTEIPACKELVWRSGCNELWCDYWFHVLTHICAEAQLPSPHEKDSFPLALKDDWVFRTGEYIVKIFGGKDPLESILRLTAEEHSYSRAESTQTAVQSCMPRLISSGLAPRRHTFPNSKASCPSLERNGKRHKADPHADLPYLVVSASEGSPLSRCFGALEFEQQVQVAVALGRVTATLHRMLSAPCCAALAKTEGSEGGGALSRRGPSASSNATGEGEGELSGMVAIGEGGLQFATEADLAEWMGTLLDGGARLWHAGKESRFWWASGKGAFSAYADHSSTIANHKSELFPVNVRWRSDVDESARLGDWYPFVAFLRWRRAAAAEEDWAARDMPPGLAAQVRDYLPDDPAELLGLGARRPGPRDRPPRWLHGDLTHDNVLVDSAIVRPGCPVKTSGLGAQVSTAGLEGPVQIIDFADAGHGDPLYDFVAVHISSLLCTDALTSAFLGAYDTSGDALSLWPDRRGLPLSYCAMCYMLLHEEDALERAMELRPELAEAGSLRQVQEGLWGVLDQWW